MRRCIAKSTVHGKIWSCFRLNSLDLKGSLGQFGCFCLDSRFDTQACQSAADDSSWKEQMLDFISLLHIFLERFQGLLYCLSFYDSFGPVGHAHASKRSEHIIGKDVDTLKLACVSDLIRGPAVYAPYSMIRLEIIDLFLEDDGPEIFTKEFYHVEMIGESRSVSRKAIPRKWSAKCLLEC